jgi:hypothetical protein
MKNLAAPSPCSSSGGCDTAGCKANSSALTLKTDTTLSPGTYCGGIYVMKGTTTFSQGTYIIVGGGIGTQDTNSIVRSSGTGITIYNTYDSKNAYQPMSFNANSDVQLKASTSGAYAGILAMQDRTCCSATMPIESFQGGTNAQFEGTLYFPRSLLQFAGNPTINVVHYSIIVALRFSVVGSSTFNNDYSVVTGGSPIQQVGLVE